MFPEPTTFNGSDPRDLSVPPKSPESLFWRGYDAARRWNAVSEFLDGYRDKGAFAPLVWEIESRLQCQCGRWLGRYEGESGLCADCHEDAVKATAVDDGR